MAFERHLVVDGPEKQISPNHIKPLWDNFVESRRNADSKAATSGSVEVAAQPDSHLHALCHLLPETFTGLKG